MSADNKVPEIRFNGFSGEWAEETLGAIAEIKTGPFGSTLHAKAYVEDGYAIITTEHFKSGELPTDKRGVPQVSDEDYLRLKVYLLKVGDIVFSRVGSVDINAHVTNKQEGWLFSGRVLRVRSNKIIDSEYLHHELSTSRVKKSVISRAVGQTMPSINTEILKVTPIHFPSDTAEQTAIGNHFQQLDSLINQHQQKYDKLGNLKKAMLEKMFPKQGETVPEIRFKGFRGKWVEVKLGEIARIKGRLGWKSLKQDEYLSDGPAMIAGKHIENGHIDWSKVDHIPEWRYIESPEIMLKNGDIIFSKDGSLGNPAVVSNIQCKATINSTMMLVRPNNNLDSNFFYQILNTKLFKELIKEKVSGSSIPHLFQADMKLFKFYSTSLEEQYQIGVYFQKLDALINQHQQQITKLNNIKQACLSKMFV
nr:restriction endonuclease subunit S [Providencia stuartii]ELR5080971.1 restriction endonuclease subunit S [Providencia stuartii]